MTKIPLTPDQLQKQLSEQLSFLDRSCSLFDSGHEDESKRIAVALRVLLHQTRNSRALLAQLGELDRPFFDSTLPNDSGLVSFSGLVFMQLGVNEPKYVAMLDDVPEFRQTPFADWWTQTVFVDDAKRALSRRDLVLTCADQDGGAHVDGALEPTYHDLSRANSLGWTKGDGRSNSPMGNPAPAALRQIAHETLKTLLPTYARKVKREGMIVGGMRVSTEPPQTIKDIHFQGPDGAPTPRTRLCPCGSGKKYKRCHGIGSMG